VVTRLAKFLIRYGISAFIVLFAYPFIRRDFFQRTYSTLLHWRSGIPSVEITDLFPAVRGAESELVFRGFLRKPGNVSYAEIHVMCVVAKVNEAKSIFEIGTFDGLTTLQLAINTPQDAGITTLDLKRDQVGHARLRLEQHDMEFIDKPNIGDRYRKTEVEYKINQVYGDSATFDFSPFHNSIDFIFIDGSHHFEYVKSDSENAMKMLSENGVIIWHDFLGWPGVTRYLLDLGKKMPLYHIKDTSLVIYKK